MARLVFYDNKEQKPSWYNTWKLATGWLFRIAMAHERL